MLLPSLLPPVQLTEKSSNHVSSISSPGECDEVRIPESRDFKGTVEGQCQALFWVSKKDSLFGSLMETTSLALSCPCRREPSQGHWGSSHWSAMSPQTPFPSKNAQSGEMA